MPQRLTEQCFISMSEGNIKKLPINESTQMVEAVDGKKYKSLGAYFVEISRYDSLNKNNRIYPKALWERVIKEQAGIYDGAAGLMNHPSEDPSVKDIFCVWHNMVLDESNQTVKAEMHLVGPHGQTAKEFLEAGGRLELSSSGFGDMQFDQQTVEPSTYLIERPADWVFDCSQSVYAKVEDEIKENTLKTESTETHKIIDTNIKEKESKVMDKLTEASVKSCQAYAKAQIQEAHKEEILTKRKAMLKEVISYCEGMPEGFESFITEATKGIEEIEGKLAEAELDAKKLQPLQEKQEVLISQSKELEESNTALKGKCENAVSVLEQARDTISTLKKERELLKGLYEQAQTEKRETIRDAKLVLKQNTKLKEQLEEKELELKRTIIREKREREVLAEQLSKILEDKKSVKEEEARKIEEAKKIEERKKLLEAHKERIQERADNTLEAKQKKLLEASGLSMTYFPEASQIVNWYADILRSNPQASEYETQILSCINLQEAINRYRVLTSGNMSSAKIVESAVVPKFSFEDTDDGPSALDNCISNTKKMYKSFK